MAERFVYADNAATTCVKPEVLDAMLPYFKTQYGNPSSIYSLGRQSRIALDNARKTVAEKLNAADNEIYFTGCGSEADNWAVKGAAYVRKDKGRHIITTKFEHHAILHTMEFLEKQGFRITYIDVNSDGIVKPEDVEKAICDDTILISVMFANNEIGTIQPIREIGAIARKHKILFHTDAVQAAGHIPIDVKEMNIDMLSLSGHKFHGPKGTGALYIRNGVALPNLLHGGAQERTKRAGTENVAGAVGLAKALEISCGDMEEKNARIIKMRDYLIDNILSKIPNSRLNGHRTKRLPGNINISFDYIEGESLLLLLDMAGIAASSGSACTSGSLDPSHVLLSIGLPHETAHGSLRLSLGDENTEEDAEYILEKLPAIIERLRFMSPLC